jgi:hypothetical protein
MFYLGGMEEDHGDGLPTRGNHEFLGFEKSLEKLKTWKDRPVLGISELPSSPQLFGRCSMFRIES